MLCCGCLPKTRKPNSPVVVWGVWYLWLASLTTLMCSVALLLCSSVIVQMLHLDLILCLSLLSGLLMLPTNIALMNTISRGEKIDPNQNVFCSPLWTCMATVIAVNFVGACLCTYKIWICRPCIKNAIIEGMRNYRVNPRYKHLIDTLQWTIKCCGLDSYSDWFNHDWYDHTRDYELDPSTNVQLRAKGDSFVSDSVPLSCCKTGSCISNYLEEMGTNSIYMSGCKQVVYSVVMSALIVQWVMFASVFFVQVRMVFLTVANLIRVRGPDEFWRKRKIFRLAAHYIGRRRNCYSVAVRNVHRALAYATKARELKKQDMKDLWNTRITAACEQHNITHFQLKEGLDRANIVLDRKSLSNLASWEPRTFESLAAVAKEKLRVDGFVEHADKKYPTGINLNLKDVMLEHWLKENKK